MKKKKLNTYSLFTLIELLVVIAIIAILASLLMPALRQARESARRVNCLSNSRSIAMMFMLYVDDYDGNFPPSGWDHGYTSNVSRNQWSAYLERQYEFGRDIYHCPSDNQSDPANPDRLYHQGAVSRLTYSYAYGLGGGWGRQPAVIGDIARPAEEMLITEATHITARRYHSFSQRSYGLYFPHSDGSVWTFVDGHAEWIEGRAAAAWPERLPQRVVGWNDFYPDFSW